MNSNPLWNIEALEPRRLLTFVATGTSGDDSIEVLRTSSARAEYEILVNGQSVGTTQEGDIRISCLAGNDQVFIPELEALSFNGPAFDIKILGGPGDDTVLDGHGEAGAEVKGGVRLLEQPGEGNDSVVFDETHPNLLTPGLGMVVKTGQIDSTFFDDNTELKEIDLGPRDDELVIDTVPNGLKVMLGEGNNVVKFGGTAKKIDADFAVGQFFAGSGTDKVIFDDTNGDDNTHRDYSITATGFLNQALDGFESAELKTRRNFGFPTARNNIFMTGAGRVLNTITVSGSAPSAGHLVTKLFIGTSTQPLDLDSLSVKVNAEFVSIPSTQYEIWDNDADHSGNPFIVDGNSNHQILQKGAFVASLINGGGLQLDVNSGSADDVFQIADTLPLSHVSIDAGAGNDTLLTIPDVSHGNAPEQVFLGSSFAYNGGTGSSDVVNLDDRSAAFTGATDEYQISTGFTKNGRLWMTHQSVDRVNFIAGGQTNIIRLDTRDTPGDTLDKFYSIDAGFGNDTITTFIPGFNGGALGANVSMALIGGPGTDTLVIDDSLSESATTQYSLDTTTFSYSGPGSGTFTFDTTLENIFVLENNRASNTQLRAKRASLNLDVELADGDDSLTLGGGDLDSNGVFASNMTVFGGAGEDSITVDDHLDNDDDGQTSNYTLDNFTLAKGSNSILYSSFERQTLLTENAVVLGEFNVIPVVNINAISSFFDRTSIVGGVNRGCNVNVGSAGNGDLTNIAGALDLQNCAITLNDQSHTSARSYNFGATQMTAPLPVTFSGGYSLTINAGPGNDSFAITGSAVGHPFTVFGNGGNDTFTLGGGNFANLAGNVSVNGGAGTDVVRFLDDSSTSHDSATLTAPALLTGGQTLSYAAVEQVSINTGPGGSILSLDSVALPTTVNGGTGDDAVSIGGGSLKNNLFANVLFNGGGGAGTDSMNLLGQNDTAKSTYAFPTLNQFRFGDTTSGKFVTFSGIEQGSLLCGSGDDTIDISIVSFALSISSGAGNDGVTVSQSTVAVHVDLGTSHPQTIFGGSAADGLSVGFIQGFPATVILDHDATVGGLSVAPDSTLRIGAGVVLSRVRPNFIDFGLGLGGTIDLVGGALLWRGEGVTPDFRTFLTRGYNAGAWNGTNPSGAINSSLAAQSSLRDGVGYGLGSEIGTSTIGAFTINATDTLLRYTLDGDANLDQSVNVSDLGILATNWQSTSKAWTDGDSNYDGSINVTDLGSLATNWQSTIAPPAAPAAAHRTTERAALIDELK